MPIRVAYLIPLAVRYRDVEEGGHVDDGYAGAVFYRRLGGNLLRLRWATSLLWRAWLLAALEWYAWLCGRLLA